MCLNIWDFLNVPPHHTYQMACISLIMDFFGCKIATAIFWHGHGITCVCRRAFPMFLASFYGSGMYPSCSSRVCCECQARRRPGTWIRPWDVWIVWSHDVDVSNSESVDGKHHAAKSTVWDYFSGKLLLAAECKACCQVLQAPSSATTPLHRDVVPWLYDDTRRQGKRKLEQAFHSGTSAIVFTANMWTSQANFCFLSTSCHLVALEFKRKSFLLGMNAVMESHTALNITHALDNISSEWDIHSNSDW